MNPTSCDPTPQTSPGAPAAAHEAPAPAQPAVAAPAPEAPVTWSQPPGADRPSDVPRQEQMQVTMNQRVFLPTVSTCPHCGGEIGLDDYCMQCGAKAPAARAHIEQQPAAWVAGVCDIGRRHEKNEDAMSLAAGPDWAAMVVCDGVTTATDSDPAAVAAAQHVERLFTHRDVWRTEQGLGEGTVQLILQAAQEANQVVLNHTAADSQNPAACTLAAAFIHGRQVVAINLGDSRVYWLPDRGRPLCLTVDHSMAQEEIEMGVDRLEAESGPHGHVITRWLGKEAPDLRPYMAEIEVDSGWVLVCSDGLWNDASAPEAMEAVFARALQSSLEPLQVARALVEWANQQGGHDNITAAVARIGSLDAEQGASTPGLDVSTVKTRPRSGGEPRAEHVEPPAALG